MKVLIAIAVAAGLAMSSLLSLPAQATLASSPGRAIKASPEALTAGKFSSRISHLKPGEPANNRTAAVVGALRKLDPHAAITTWTMSRDWTNSKFAFAFVHEGNGKYLTEKWSFQISQY